MRLAGLLLRHLLALNAELNALLISLDLYFFHQLVGGAGGEAIWLWLCCWKSLGTGKGGALFHVGDALKVDILLMDAVCELFLFGCVVALPEIYLAPDLLQFLFLVADAFFEFLLIRAHILISDLEFFDLFFCQLALLSMLFFSFKEHVAVGVGVAELLFELIIVHLLDWLVLDGHLIG